MDNAGAFSLFLKMEKYSCRALSICVNREVLSVGNLMEFSLLLDNKPRISLRSMVLA